MKRGDLSNARELRTVRFERFEFRAADGDKPPHFSGYATVFDTPYVIRDWFGEYNEIVVRGAFAETLKAKADVRLLVNHEGLPLARTSSGTLKLVEDAKGLKVDADLDAEDPDVQRLRPKMARGDLGEMSFAFRVRKQQWTFSQSKDVLDERKLLDLDLDDGDVSVVTYPANPGTSASVRDAAGAALEQLPDSPLVRVAARLVRGAGLEDIDEDLVRSAIALLEERLRPAVALPLVNQRARSIEIEALA